MASSTSALIIIMSINFMLILGNMAAFGVNPNMSQDLIKCSTTPLSNYGKCGQGTFTQNTTDPSQYFAQGQASVDPEGTSSTDLWLTIKNWVIDTVPGARLLSSIISAPSNFLVAIGIPNDFAGLFGAMWWAITIIIFLNWVRGITD